ncbi:MAG: hypothetical protein HPY66_2267 [Firmicutes bacterium]|nr:hypothetical protein [Bacillota bacterium]
MSNVEIIPTLRYFKNFDNCYEIVKNYATLHINRIRFNLVNNDIHDYHDFFSKLYETYYTAIHSIPNILLDIPYPCYKNRIYQDHTQAQYIKENDIIILTTEYDTNDRHTFIVDANLPLASIKNNSTIIIGDGELLLTVIQTNHNTLTARALNSSELRGPRSVIFSQHAYQENSNKSMFNAICGLIRNYNIKNICLSLVENHQQVQIIKKEINEHNIYDFHLIPKIETPKSVKGLSSILKSCTEIIIGRGDLGLLTDYIHLTDTIDFISELCCKEQVKVIIATDVLQSLTTRSIPSRADIVDLNYLAKKRANGVILTSNLSIHRSFTNAVEIINKMFDTYSI